MSSSVVKKSQLNRESDWYGMSNFVHFYVVQEIYIFLSNHYHLNTNVLGILINPNRKLAS